MRPILDGRVTLAVGAGWVGSARLVDPAPSLEPQLPSGAGSGAIVLGAVQNLGYRPLPLVQVNVSRRLSLDAYASWSVDLGGAPVRDRYLGGFTYVY